MTTISELSSKIEIISANPAAIQRLLLRAIRQSNDGTSNFVVDASNPAVFLLEANIATTSAIMNQNDAMFRKLFKSLSTTPADLYYHMSDADYLDRFATPGMGSFNFLLHYEEVLNKAVLLTDGSGVKLLKIPKHTYILVAGIVFTMQYAIDIRVLPQGGITVVYDTSTVSPLETLISNNVDWTIVTLGGYKFISLKLNIKQMNITSQTAQLNAITGFSTTYVFSDKFHYARAYTKNENDNQWVEIKTTHTEQVHDASYPTVALQVLGQQLKVTVPQIYFNNGLIKNNLRIDIYTTKGALELNLGNYDTRAFQITWLDKDTELVSQYAAPFNTFSGFIITSTSAITTGVNGLAFDELRNRVIDDSGKKILPITDKQLYNPQNTLGYTLVKNIDNITDRQFLAAKLLPPPTNGVSVTGAGCGIHTLQTTFTALTNNSNVANNISRLTIKPSTIFKSVNGIFEVVPDIIISELLNPLVTTAESLANAVNSNNYFYTPFHYVLDATSDEFDIRPYLLNSPKVIGKFFNEYNPTLLIDSSTKSYVFDIDPNGYSLTVELDASTELKALDLDRINLQLSYTPPNTNTMEYINGVLITPIDGGTDKPLNDRYIYKFTFNTNFDIDSNNRIILTPSLAAMDLDSLFYLTVIVKNHLPLGATVTGIDSLYSPSAFVNYDSTATYRGIVSEKYTLQFGVYLKHLWNRARSLASTLTYQRYTTDVPMVYTENVYERDVNGNLVLIYNSGTSQFEPVLLHAYGDQVYDEYSEPRYIHKVGDVVTDPNGEPVLVNSGRDVLRQMDILFVDGKYFFATSDSSVAYRDEYTATLSKWITNDIEILNEMVINRSEVLFYPRTTVGELEVLVTDTTIVKIPADQHFKVVYHVRDSVFNSQELKDNIKKATGVTIAKCLESTTVARSNITDKLKEVLGDDVLGVTLTSEVFGDDKYNAFTLIDASVAPSIGKQLVALSNQTLAVQDAISVEFIKLLK